MALANRLADNAAAGIADLFGGGGGGAEPRSTCAPVRPGRRWSGCDDEFEAVGFYLSGHPLDDYESVLAQARRQRYAEFEATLERGRRQRGRLAGIVVSARERRSQKGNKFAFAMFSDATGQFEAVIFSDTLAAARDLLEPGTPVLLSVEAERDGETLKMRVRGHRGARQGRRPGAAGGQIAIPACIVCGPGQKGHAGVDGTAEARSG